MPPKPAKKISKQVGPPTKKLARSAKTKQEKPKKPEILARSPKNPVIKPSDINLWESKATFNPAAIYENGRIHILYRAIGNDDSSVLGYASSTDGTDFSERLMEPAYSHKKEPVAKRSKDYKVPYSSGGGWSGGCEDPRLVLIDGVVYLLYTAFDGWGSIRIALSSISADDFVNKRWMWTKPRLLSPPNEIHKNWVIFPEKINGKFAVLHSISPEILIDYVDSLEGFETDEDAIKSAYTRAGRRKSWDSWMRGAGPPPIKTSEGWLLLYHAMDDADPNRYKLGAMLLDSKDPTKILYRSSKPILEPDFNYENEGFKAGVVYSCGAIVVEGELMVYYGGADKYTCVASANLEKFLKELKEGGKPQLTRPKLKAKK